MLRWRRVAGSTLCGFRSEPTQECQTYFSFELSIGGASSTPAEIYSKRPSERLLRVIFHRKTAKKGI
jgi:hypothetical protein